jgi:hypothetical protein
MPITECGPNRPSSCALSLLEQLPLPASPSESARARISDPNEWTFAKHNSPHFAFLATERHAELKGVYEGLMTDNPTRRRLHIERRVADERHRQFGAGGCRDQVQKPKTNRKPFAQRKTVWNGSDTK